MKQQPHLFVDCDVLVYRHCFGCIGYDLPELCKVLDQTIYKIIERLNIPYTLVISSTEKTFRHDIAVTAPYKGKRKVEKPEWYNEVRQYLVEQWQAVMAPAGIEADDYIGIHSNRKSIIASIDKDLKMLPVAYYYHIPAKGEWTLKKIKRPMYYFWWQMLVGDTADNIIGLSGIGEKKATALLKGVKLKDMKAVVMREYEREFKEKAAARFDENARLLWIKRNLKKEYYDYI